MVERSSESRGGTVERTRSSTRPPAPLTDRALGHRLRIEELLAGLSARLIDVGAEAIDDALRGSLRVIGEHERIDRCLLLELGDDLLHARCTHEWCADGIAPYCATPEDAPWEPLTWATSSILRGELYFADRVRELPECAALQDAGVRSVAAVPLSTGGRVFGALVFHAVRNQPSWSDALVRWKLLSAIFSNTLHRQRTERSLAERLRFEELLAALSARFIAARPDEIDDVVVQALQQIGETQGFGGAAVTTFSRDGAELSVTHEWCAESPAEGPVSIPCRLPSDGAAAILEQMPRDRGSILFPGNLPEPLRTITEEAGLEATIAIPITTAGIPVGALTFHITRGRGRVSEHFVARLGLVVDVIANALARRDAARESWACLGRVVEHAPYAVVLADAEGEVVEWSAGAARLFGRARGEALGQRAPECLGFAGSFRQLVTSASTGVEIASGRARVEVTSSEIDLDGAPMVALFARDVTACKRAFEELAVLKERAELERDSLREQIQLERDCGVIGTSAGARRVMSAVTAVAATDATVLIRGESGVGKELVARTIHERSRRASGPLVKVNCAAVPRELFESEFFGHARGAFTGAVRDRVGRFELAEGGTLFLDEIGEIPLELQAKLLRVLQEGELERVGDDRTRRVDVRVIAATNRDLERDVEQGRFRRDLYYRLSVFPVDVPALRERREDIVPLAEHFLRVRGQALGRSTLRLTDAHREALVQHRWPGNVRELQNVIERAVILSPHPPLRLDAALHAKQRATSEWPPAAARPRSGRSIMTVSEMREWERENVLAALEQAGWRISGQGGAAGLLEMKPSTLRDRMKALSIRRE